MSDQVEKSSFSIKSDTGAEIQVFVLGYERLYEKGVSDANWLNAKIAFSSGGCSFHYHANITTNDIKYFLVGLEQALSTLEGRASLLTDEEGIILHLDFSRRGGVNIFGELKDTDLSNTTVTFEMSSDQSYLTSACSQLREISRAYPVVESAV